MGSSASSGMELLGCTARTPTRRLSELLYTFSLCVTIFLFMAGIANGMIADEDISDEFYVYETVKPTAVIFTGSYSRIKRDSGLNIGNTSRKHEVSSSRLRFSAFGREFDLELQPNPGVVADGFVVTILGKTSDRTYHPAVEDCHYRGKLRGKRGSNAAISICKSGISGFVQDGSGETYHIKPSLSDSTAIVVTRESDAIPVEKFCGVDLNMASKFFPNDSDPTVKQTRCSLAEEVVLYADDVFDTFNSLEPQNHLVGASRNRRNVQPPSGNNPDSLYVEIVLVADSKLYEKYGRDESQITSRFIEIVTVVNALYWPLNIFVALTGVEIWSAGDKISMNNDSETTLKSFLKYRREDLLLRMPNDNAYLITGFTFNGNVVGKALKGQMCSYQYSGGLAKDHSRLPGPVGSTVAHEMGHNFGMDHDFTDCSCPEDRCIMTPASIGLTPSNWSSCSRKYLQDHVERGIATCLTRVPKHVMGPFCGNGFLEDGEECDCGPEEYCKNRCCIASACKLSVNATCGHGNCCDLGKCTLKPMATTCREPANECDLPEFCDGHTGTCPGDFWVIDGTGCKNGQAFCFAGSCATPADQCLKIWGQTGAVADDKCFGLNVKGNANGNCGHDRATDTYTMCTVRDVKCGLLHCTSQVERLALGADGSGSISQSYIPAKTTYINCRSAYVDFGLSVPDPGMVPNGAKCAEDSMCLNSVCTHVSLLPTLKCPENCGGSGICNNLGHCHCTDGYAPPSCLSSGYGGSIDSGPAISSLSYRRLRDAMLVLFLLVIPVIGAALFFYFGRYRVRDWLLMKRKLRRTGGKTPKQSAHTNGKHTNGGKPSHEVSISVPASAADTGFVASFQSGSAVPRPPNSWPAVNLNEAVYTNVMPPPLPRKPPKAVRDLPGDSPKLVFSPNRSPPRDMRPSGSGLLSAEEEPLSPCASSSSQPLETELKPIRPAPPPPPIPAVSRTAPASGSIRRPSGKPPEPPQRPVGPQLDSKKTGTKEPSQNLVSAKSVGKETSLVAEMTKVLESRKLHGNLK